RTCNALRPPATSLSALTASGATRLSATNATTARRAIEATRRCPIPFPQRQVLACRSGGKPKHLFPGLQGVLVCQTMKWRLSLGDAQRAPAHRPRSRAQPWAMTADREETKHSTAT